MIDNSRSSVKECIVNNCFDYLSWSVRYLYSWLSLLGLLEKSAVVMLFVCLSVCVFIYPSVRLRAGTCERDLTPASSSSFD